MQYIATKKNPGHQFLNCILELLVPHAVDEGVHG